jgi:hypothetical protein
MGRCEILGKQLKREVTIIRNSKGRKLKNCSMFLKEIFRE